MAMPSIIMAESGERIAIADGDTVEASEDASTPNNYPRCGDEVSIVKFGCFGRYGGLLVHLTRGKIKVSSPSDY